jgi:arylformamidase
MEYIDVSFSYYSGMAIYPNNPDFSMWRVQNLEKGDKANVSRVSIGTHSGTHIDAPSHFISGGKSIDEIPLEDMNGIAKVFDFRGYEEISQNILASQNIEMGDIIILKTDNSDNFHGNAILENYVTLNYNAAKYLAEKKIKMVCIDYMTIETPRKRRVEGKSVHSILLGNGILIAEALNLIKVKKGVYQLYCFPINIIGADGVPARIVLAQCQEK